MNGWGFWVALALPSVAAAQSTGVSDEDLVGFLGNMRVEARIDADIDRDGVKDVAFVASDTHERILGVISGAGPAGKLGQRVLAEGRLPAQPQALPVLTWAHGELRLDDLTGDDTVTTSTCRYRFDATARRLRLASMQAETYSASLAHAATRVRWDVLKGVQITEEGQVVTLDTGEQVYVYAPEVRSHRATTPLYVEQAPDAVSLLTAAQAAGRVATAGGQELGAPAKASEN